MPRFRAGYATALVVAALASATLPAAETSNNGSDRPVASGAAVKSLRLVLPPQPSPVVERIGRVFVRQVQSRCDAQVLAEGAKARFTLELALQPGIGTEGYQIANGPPGTVRILGNDERGLLYGVGKFLHTSAYTAQGFTPSSWRGVSVPKLPVRGMYFATHFHNFYQDAPLEEVSAYIEDLALWGTNSFMVCFGTEEFTGIHDPKAQEMLDRLRALLKTVKDLGLDATMSCIGNDGYKDDPRELRADDSTVGHAHYHTKMGPRIYNLGHELCPSKPGVPEMEVTFLQEKLEAFREVGLDCWVFWPYDNGGCTCPNCAPWGANGYPRMAELLARTYRQAFPQGKVILSTWYFNRWADGEWEGLAAKFQAQKPDWVDYLLADNYEAFPRYPLEQGVPGGLPLLNFPDISMWAQEPWGGYGANPHPARLRARWDETAAKLSGGFPYSEGIYEDLNKVICERLYWDPDRPAIEAVKEYIAFECSPEVVDDVTAVVETLEANHARNRIGASAVAAYQTMERVDAQLTPQARRSWRWRLLLIRATIDQEMYRSKLDQGRDEVFRQAYEELMQISHAANAWPMLKPVCLRAAEAKNPPPPPNYGQGAE